MISFSGTQKAWTERSHLEKTLLKAVAFLVFLVICLLITVGVISSKHRKESENFSVCRTNSCIELGTNLQRSMDLSKDPCQDFYNYTCGGWLKAQGIPSGYQQYGVIQKLNDDALIKLTGLLSEEGKFGNSSAVRNAMQFYSSCMNISAIEDRGINPMLRLLSEIGGWPVINEKWNNSAFDWISAVAEIHWRTGYGFILLLIVGPDAKNTSSNVLQLDSPSFGLGVDVLLNPKKNTSIKEIEGYRKFFKSVALLMSNKTINPKKLDEDFNGIIEFETALAKMMTPEDDKRSTNVWYNKMSVGNLSHLSESTNQVDWLRFFQLVTNSSLLKFDEKAVVKSTTPVIVLDVDYIRNVSNYLMNHQIRRQVANYLGWRLITTHMRYLPSRFQEALQNYSQETGIGRPPLQRSELCTLQVKYYFSQAASFLFINRYFEKNAKQMVNLLATLLRDSFDDMFDASWIDHKTRTAAKLKLKVMKQNIGYPEWMRNAEDIDKYYNEIRTPQMTVDVFENDLDLKQHSTMQAISTLVKPKPTQVWSTSPLTVDANYNPNRNEITIPAAFLQFPMYEKELPGYNVYATIGTVIAHEISHGFDNEGMKRNATGNIHKWWSPEFEEHFNASTKCFVDQYDGYKVNGRRTLAENIADNVGLRQAYKTFLKSNYFTTKSQFPLPKFEHFSLDQLFFISYASIHCTKYPKAVLEDITKHGIRSPAEFRVQGTVSNMEEFAAAFKCRENVSYNREKRCVIWE